jgi:hypothetical protein
MSAPHISGIAALIMSKYPTWTPMAVKSELATAAAHRMQHTPCKGTIVEQRGLSVPLHCHADNSSAHVIHTLSSSTCKHQMNVQTWASLLISAQGSA